jgi:hypothetical protein
MTTKRGTAQCAALGRRLAATTRHAEETRLRAVGVVDAGGGPGVSAASAHSSRGPAVGPAVLLQ